MNLSKIAQFIIGFILGIGILAGAAVGTVYYFFTKLAAEPEKPVFAEERPKKSPSPKAQPTSSSGQSKPATTPKPIPSPSPLPTLEPGAYRASVTWPQGLILRDSPSLNAQRIGGIGYNQTLIILGYSDDKRWQRVRLPGSDQKGWVKAGNVKKIN
ncbi:MAG: SH3 domain-containing protein [Moorea sp. SIO3C2]|nr:SH3 domain-containing protein [Moorena sp. SIO3C2]